MKKLATLVVVTAALIGWTIAHFHQRGDATRANELDDANAAAHPTTSLQNVEQPIPPAPLVELDRKVRKFVLSQKRHAKQNGPTLEATNVGESALATAPPASTGKVVTDPVARVALIFVGADPAAEAYWFDAINDPTLSPSERQDLIEDLNEEGFPDPHHPTADDLPLIVNRLELIEEIAWEAMDEVNSDAFAEAHKDLVRMAQIAEAELE
jgi:hypothetical protein